MPHIEKKVCAYCQKVFLTQHPKQRYCSYACAALAARQGHAYGKGTCPVCGEEFVRKSANQRYCSGACKSENYRRTHMKETAPKVRAVVERVCPTCGKTFTIGDHSDQTYCSKLCSNKARRAYGKSFCLHCGQEYTRATKAQMYCCPECARAAYRDRMLQRRDVFSGDGPRPECLRPGQNLRVCPECGQEFRIHSSGQEFCSEECRQDHAAREEPEKTWHCHDCGCPCDTYRCPECRRKWLKRCGYSASAIAAIEQAQADAGEGARI